MQRETIGVTVLSIAVAVVLGLGAYLWLSIDETDSTDASTETSAGADPGPTLDVPRCPISLSPGADFEKVPLDRKTPHLRLRSSRRGITVDVSCKTADERFDRRDFLQQTLEAVRQKFEGDLLGEREFGLGEASGWTIRAEKEGTMRLTNVLIHDRNIVLINVAGPIDPASREYNTDLIETRLHWPGVN